MTAVITATNLPAVIATPTGLTPDNVANHGYFGFLANANAVRANSLVSIAYGAATTLTLTGAQFVAGFIDLSGSGVLALTTPTAAQIVAALPGTIPKDGTFSYRMSIINDDTGQTTTLTGGSGVTVLGNNTLATNTRREFLVNVNVNAGTVTMLNLGTVSL